MTKNDYVLQALKRKKSMVDYRMVENGVHVRSFCRSAVISIQFTEKPPWWSLLFSIVADFISESSLKEGSTTETFPLGSAREIFSVKFPPR